MSNLRPQVRSAIRVFLQSQEGHHQMVDVLRVVEEEAMLMKETTAVCDALDADPTEQLEEWIKGGVGIKGMGAGENPRRLLLLNRLKRMLRVTACSRVRTGHDHCGIDAVVTFGDSGDGDDDDSGNDNDNKNNHHILQLTFRYERRRPPSEGDNRAGDGGCHVRYSIQMSLDHQQRQDLLVVQVWAPSTVPSHGKAVCINRELDDENDDEHDENDEDDEDDDGWEDIDDEEGIKAQKVAPSSKSQTSTTVVSDNSSSKSESQKKKQQQQQQQDHCRNEEDAGAKRRKVHNNNDSPPKRGRAPNEIDCTPKKQSKKKATEEGQQRPSSRNVDIDTDEEEEDAVAADGTVPVDDDDNKNKSDTYMAYLDPDLLHQFVDLCSLQPIEEATAFFLLMTFPFYELEWDLVGYVLDEIFGDDDDDDVDDEEEEGGGDDEEQ